MSEIKPAQAARDARPFDEQIKETQVGGCRLLMLRSEVENVVQWRGSFISNPDFAGGEELVQSMLVSLLDKGTQQLDKYEIADVLENKGAQVHFNSRGLRIGFSGRSLRDDFNEVFSIQIAQLLNPRIAEDEHRKAQARLTAAIQRNMEQTGTRAGLALRQLLYPVTHPNYSFSPQSELLRLQEINVSMLRAYHEKHFGSKDCILVVVGDIDMDAVEQTVSKMLSSWASHDVMLMTQPAYAKRPPEIMHVPMHDKFNLDVKLGHQVDMRRLDKDFTPLHIGNYILGGNFSSRLMDVIRDEMGLTYGVHSSLIGISKHYNGHWQISITLSRDKLDEGIAATRALVSDFIIGGATEAEVEEKKTTLIGSYKVRMGTTGELAGMILRSLEQGFGKDRLDTYADEVAATNVDDINRALRTYLDPSALHLATAGTRPDQDLKSQN